MATPSNISTTDEAGITQSNEPEPKTFSVTLPADLAAKAEGLAEREGRDLSDIFSEAFREYWSETAFRSLEHVRAYAATRNPHGYTEEDIPRLIKEARAEEAAELVARETAKAS
jgi:metal-responsive CopG/Arc/MetJ family transcriptional regulator